MPHPLNPSDPAPSHPEPSTAPTQEARTLRELSPRQWKTGIAAWLGWLFDGLDMHLYGLVAAPFVATLLHASVGDPIVKERSAWIQAAFMVGWALGGAFFGRLGDKIGRSRALSLTILTYALFTGLSFFVTNWWQLGICRFLAALGVGGEWAVGASLLAETWPKKWRPWIAAVLQTGVNIGILLACVAVNLLSDYPDRYVFLVGVLPAFLVLWIRRNVPEPDEWKRAKESAKGNAGGIADLFRGEVRRTSLLVIGVCSLSLTAWWGFMFWHIQQLQSLPEVVNWSASAKKVLVSNMFFTVISASIAGNFFASWMARRIGYNRAIAVLLFAFAVSITGAYAVPRDHHALFYWLAFVGFCSGIFGLFTMYLPPLFPVLLRTTGAGFCYNIGRVAAALGLIIFGSYLKVGDFRVALLADAGLFLAAFFVALFLPDLTKEEGGAREN